MNVGARGGTRRVAIRGEESARAVSSFLAWRFRVAPPTSGPGRGVK